MTTNIQFPAAGMIRSIARISCALAVSAIPARSQDSESGAAYDLDAHVVVANRYAMPIEQVGSSVETLDSFELGKGQETFLVDNLRLVSGLYLRNAGGPGSTFGMTTRGLATNTPTILVNGIEVSNASTGQMINLGNLFTDNVSRVEVLKGPQSSLYGADALAGVISIDTRPADGQEQTRLSASYGAYSTRQFGAGHSGSAGAFSWSIDGNLFRSAGYSNQDPDFGPEWADDDAYRNKNASGYFRYAFDDETDVYLSTYYFDAYSEFDPGVPPVWGTPFADNYSKNKSLFAKLGSHFAWGEKVRNEASFAYSSTDYLSFAGYEYEANGDRYKAEWQSAVAVSERWRFVAGADFEREENRSDIGERDNASLFAENLFALTPSLDVTLGGRFDDNSAYGSEATYRGTFSYRLEEYGARIRGSYGSSFEAPSFYELFNPYYGDENLKPESGHGWDLGIEKTLQQGRLFLAATLFGNDIEDKIVWSGKYANVDTYDSHGLETAIRWQIAPDLRLVGAYTFAKGEENDALEALRVPRNVYSLGLHWAMLDRKLDLSANALKVSSQYSDAGDRAIGTRQPGYATVNLAAQYVVSEISTLWIRLDNALDADYREVKGYMTPGRSLSGGVKLRF